MAVLRAQDNRPDYDSIHKRLEMDNVDNVLNNEYIDPGTFAKYITTIDTGHGKTPSKNSTRFMTDDGSRVSLSGWYWHGQVLKTSPWGKLYEDENDWI